jgi:hypothetical protein
MDGWAPLIVRELLIWEVGGTCHNCPRKCVAGLGVAAVSRGERERTESETTQVGPIGAVGCGRPVRICGSAGLAAAAGRLDGQDGQLPVGQAALRRPGALRLDDVGHVIGAGIRLPVSLPGPRGLKLDLKARRVRAMRIGVALARHRPIIRRNHVPPGSPGVRPPAGLRRGVIKGHSSLGSA